MKRVRHVDSRFQDTYVVLDEARDYWVVLDNGAGYGRALSKNEWVPYTEPEETWKDMTAGAHIQDNPTTGTNELRVGDEQAAIAMRGFRFRYDSTCLLIERAVTQ